MTKTSKEALATIALNLFSRRGYRETSVGDIEDAAGLTRRAGGFYRHFKSKEAVLAYGLRRMEAQLLAEIPLDDILSHENVREELLFIANSLLAHAKEHRAMRLLLQREAHKLPALRAAMQKANLSIARQDIVPWTAYALRRAGLEADPLEFAFVIFGPVLLHLISQDRGQPAFGLSEGKALQAWADYWEAQLRPRRARCSR